MGGGARQRERQGEGEGEGEREEERQKAGPTTYSPSSQPSGPAVIAQ